MKTQTHISPHDINGLVQREAGNEEFIQLSQERVDEIHDHLLECEACNREYVQSKRIYEDIAVALTPKKESRSGWYWVAAAAVVLSLFYWAGYQYGSNNGQKDIGNVVVAEADDPIAEQVQSKSSDNQPELAKEDVKVKNEPVPNHQLLAANFQSNEELEELVNSPLRSSTLAIVSPLNGARIEGSIQFDWEGNASGSVTLKIIDNRDEIIFEEEVTDGQFLYHHSLEPGRYYWSLENEEEVLSYGTFFYRYFK